MDYFYFRKDCLDMIRRLYESKLPKDLDKYLQDCLDEFIEETKINASRRKFSQNRVHELMEKFQSDYPHAPQHYLYYDFYATLKAIKSYSINDIYDLYSPSQDEFDEAALFSALDKLIMADFTQQNESRFIELSEFISSRYKGQNN